jgi:magnesium chelatase family protein
MAEASIAKGIEIATCRDLTEALDILGGGRPRSITRPVEKLDSGGNGFDYSQVLGQQMAKRALQVAAAGGHHVLMIGQPGSGKTMLARRFPGILPPLDDDEALEHAKIMSVTGRFNGGRSLWDRPFRTPHHSASDAGLIGGGRNASPGEITLAHNGVLFLDELTEFRRNVLETLRQPLEEGRIVISRANTSCCYPAKFQLLAAMNPCPCGFHGSRKRACKCSLIGIKRYLSKISGPLLDRISICIPVRAVDTGEFDIDSMERIPSEKIRNEVKEAVNIQRERYRGREGLKRNADAPLSILTEIGAISDSARAILDRAQRALSFSARSRRNILQVARTIADIERSCDIKDSHMAEAIQYRVSSMTPDADGLL